MQHETQSHGINMSALGRDKQSLSLAQETVAIEVPGLSCTTVKSRRCSTSA